MSRVDSVGIAKQTGAGAGGLGTKQTVMEYFVPVESAEPGTNTETMEAEETVGHPFPTDREPGSQYFEPSMTFKARGASLPRVLSPFMGDPLTTTPDAALAPTARNHNFDPVTRPTPRAVSLLLSRSDPDPAITDLLWDCIGQEITIGVEPNDWITAEAGFVARDIDEARPEPVVAADLTRRFRFYECLAYITVAGGGETVVDVGDFGLTFGLNVPTDDLVLGSRRLHKITTGNRDAEVTFTPKEDLALYYRRAILLEPESIKLRLEALGPIIGGAVRHKVEIIVHRCFQIEAPADIDAGDPLTGIEVSAGASYDATAGKFVEVNVVNTVAAY